jgi:hypothetical protein
MGEPLLVEDLDAPAPDDAQDDGELYIPTPRTTDRQED